MDYLLFRSYPPPLPSQRINPSGRKCMLTPRQVRRMIDLGWLLGIVILLLWLRHEANRFSHPPLPPESLPFQLVAKRSDQLESEMSAKDVFALLGPVRFERFWEPEMEEFEERRQARPSRYPDPNECYWAKWADPADLERWVAILICHDRAYKIIQHGVGRMHDLRRLSPTYPGL